ncbi:MAG TPA: MaoC/PaaZ C-terminal domain-containing protein [Flavipsychrobacter sp.]|nr:MaoC/PaaZ C-terminal domain-containing protein [Flavipsychrobacter sp.]
MQTGDNFQLTFFVSEAVYNGFINTFNDRNILHTNDEFATSKGFKGKVVHGNVMGGFVSYFVGECLPMKNVIIHKQEMLFPKPVYINERLNFIANIIDYSAAVNTYEIKFKFLNEANERVCYGKVQIGLI